MKTKHRTRTSVARIGGARRVGNTPGRARGNDWTRPEESRRIDDVGGGDDGGHRCMLLAGGYRVLERANGGGMVARVVDGWRNRLPTPRSPAVRVSSYWHGNPAAPRRALTGTDRPEFVAITFRRVPHSSSPPPPPSDYRVRLCGRTLFSAIDD